MKKKLVIFSMFLLLGINIFATEYKFYEGSCYEANDLLGKLYSYDFYINYDTELNVFAFTVVDYFETKVLVFSKENIASLRKNIEKYFEWNDLAIEKQTTLSKQLPDSHMEVTYLELSGNDVYSSFNFGLDFVFFSQNKLNHQLVIMGDTVPSMQNEYIDCEISDLYFDNEQITQLYNAFSEENIAAKMKEYEEKAEVENLFQ